MAASYDLIVLGAGPGGYVAALRAAKLGARVLLVEREAVGGVCLNRGCIPTKSLIASAEALRAVKRASSYGVRVASEEAAIDMPRVQSRKEEIVVRLREGIEKLLSGLRVELKRGHATILEPGKIEIAGEILSAKHLLIATGSTWIDLPALPIDGDRIVTTDHALDWQEVPQTLLIVGGGVIGCEFACMMRVFGAQVTIVEATSSILPPVERAISRLLTRSFKEQGIAILTDTRLEAAHVQGDGVTAKLSSGEEIVAQRVLVAAGRRPRTAEIGIEKLGITQTERGAIDVDANFQTSIPGILAIGDVIGDPMLAHAASAQGIAAVEGLFGEGTGFDRNVLPQPIFSHPEIASVGKTAETLKQEGISFRTGRFSFAASGKAQCDGEPEGQAIVHASEEGKILGAHIIGHQATLLIPEFALAMQKGLSARDVEETIHAHPTLSEIAAEAAADIFGRAVHKASRVR